MDNQTSESLEKIRQLFENAPYPRIPLESSPKQNSALLYTHNIITPYYLRKQKVIETEGKVILDAGCGTGYKSLILAEANPGAKIVGIDISEKSIELAKERLHYHGFATAEFYCLPMEDLPTLEWEFDYINNDEVLYVVPDPIVALRAMKSVLKPEGIIRTNYHSSRQRYPYFQIQEFFQKIGVMDTEPQHLAIEMVRETMRALNDQVFVKETTWKPAFETDDQRVLMNCIIQGDRGYNIAEMFSALRNADLDFISMVNWRQWELAELFKDLDNLPVFLAMSLSETSVEERLYLFELLHPIHRLLDLWCGHPNQAKTFVPVSEWTRTDWQGVQVHLHPQLRTANLREDLLACITDLRTFEISQHLLLAESAVTMDSSIAVCLLPLLEKPQPMMSLVERWKQGRPVHPVTLEPTEEEEAFDIVKNLLTWLESLGYILLERQS